MTEVVIRNQQFMDRLNEISDELLSMSELRQKKYWTTHGEDGIIAGTKYTEEEYLRECLSGSKIIGAPVKHFAQPIRKMVKVIRIYGKVSNKK